jgi:hypothetical protein
MEALASEISSQTFAKRSPSSEGAILIALKLLPNNWNGLRFVC